jgi:hypothetical protein
MQPFRHLALALFLLAPALSAQDQPATKEKAADWTVTTGTPHWHQPGGSALRWNSSETEPLLTEPKLLWAKDLGAMALQPIAWGDTLFVITSQGSSRKLQALSAIDGTPLGQAVLGSQEELFLGAWESQVVVVQREVISLFSHRGKDIKLMRSLPGKYSGEPLLWKNLLFVESQKTLQAVDLSAMRVVASTPGVYKGLTLADPVGNQLGYVQSATHPNYVGLFITASRLPIDAWVKGGKEGKAEPSFVIDVAKLIPLKIEQDIGQAAVMRVGADETWGIVGTKALQGFTKTAYGLIVKDGEARGIMIVGRPALVRGGMYGFSEEGVLIHQQLDGSYYPVIDAAERPQDAQAGPPTGARQVLYLGNWAVDVTTRRVLWVSSSVPKNLPALPLGPGRIAFVEGKKLSMFGSGAPREAASAAIAGGTSRRSAPGEGNGVVLFDGTRLDGDIVEGAEGKLIVGKEKRSFTDADFALVEAGGEADLRPGGEWPLFLAWRSSLARAHREALTGLFEKYRSQRLTDECRRIVEESTRLGASAAELKSFNDRLAGTTRSTASNLEAQRERIAGEEKGLRTASADRAVAALEWCASRSWTRAASALAGFSLQISPQDERALKLAAEWIDPAFPWADKPEATEQWLAWSESLLASEGEFVAKDAAIWKGFRGKIWESGTIVLRSRNLVLVSREQDREIVSGVLRDGELAIGALELLLSDNPHGRRAARDSERLQVRLHRNREDYLNENGEEGAAKLSWTAGYYSPGENVSRFYVPEENRVLSGMREQQLFSVVAHELTHHYLDQVWSPMPGGQSRSRADAPGFWVIEGIARFVEDQVLEFERHGPGFDDPTVESLDAAAVLSGLGELFPAAKILDMDNNGFQSLTKIEEGVEIKLRNTLQGRRYTPTAVFYDQAGALSYFFIHAQGPEGRAKFIDYMRRAYTAKQRKEAWKQLGYETPEALQKAFEEFLKASQAKKPG